MIPPEYEYIRTQFLKDKLATYLGMEIVEIGADQATVRMRVEEHHLNSVDITHGGSVYSLADFAFAIAGNSSGQIALSMQTSLSITKATKLGDMLTAVATLETATRKTGLYRVEVRDQHNDFVALMTGTVYRKNAYIPGAPEAE